MKSKLRFAILRIALAATGVTACLAEAVAQEPPKIGIINIEMAIIGSKEGQRDFAALQQRWQPKQAELQALNKEVEDLKKQLGTQGDKIDDDTRASLVRTIEQKQKNLQRSAEDAQGAFKTEQKDLATQIGRKMLVVLDAYARQNGFATIFDISGSPTPVLWAGRYVDVTKDVVGAYDVASGLAVPGAPPLAPASLPTKAGVINIRQAIVNNNEGQRDFAALEKRFDPKQNELHAMNREVEDLKKQLSTRGSSLTEDARSSLARSIEQKEKAYSRSLEDAQSDFQSQKDDLADRIGRKVLTVLDKYARENDFAVVFDVSDPQHPAQDAVLWARSADVAKDVVAGAVDVTATIVNLYDQQSGVPPLAQAGRSGAPPSQPNWPAPVESKPASHLSQLSLVTRPGSVQAYLDEAFKGITSEREGRLRIENLTPGSHRLRLTLPGYQEWSQNLNLSAGETLPMQVTLEPVGNKPLTEAEIEEALTNGMGNKRTAELVDRFGVDFTLTEEIKARLRQLGANDKLLLEIATNRK